MKKVKILCIVLVLMLSLGTITVNCDSEKTDKASLGKELKTQIGELEEILRSNADSSNAMQVIHEYFEKKNQDGTIMTKEEANLLLEDESQLLRKVELGENAYVKFYSNGMIEFTQLKLTKPAVEETMNSDNGAIINSIPWVERTCEAESHFEYNDIWLCDQYVSVDCEYNESDVRYSGSFSAYDENMLGVSNLVKTHFKDSTNIIYIGKISGNYIYDFDNNGNPLRKYCKTMVGCDKYGDLVDPSDYGW